MRTVQCNADGLEFSNRRKYVGRRLRLIGRDSCSKSIFELIRSYRVIYFDFPRGIVIIIIYFGIIIVRHRSLIEIILEIPVSTKTPSLPKR